MSSRPQRLQGVNEKDASRSSVRQHREMMDGIHADHLESNLQRDMETRRIVLAQVNDLGGLAVLDGDGFICPTRSSEACCQSPCDLAPPVTLLTLRELELHRIIKNPKLRHNINFDPNLQFRPSTEGERYYDKRRRDGAYWLALSKEIKLSFGSSNLHVDEHRCSLLRLQHLFCELRNILITLVPSRDVQVVRDILDVPLLMQQVVKSTLAYGQLAQGLAYILKSHCAPMRDHLVDNMVQLLIRAAREMNVEKLVEGVRMLLGILEAMKLVGSMPVLVLSLVNEIINVEQDVANHQVRNIRSILIEDTVIVERCYFEQEINSGKLDPEPARLWYNEHRRYWDYHDDSGETTAQEEAVATLLKAVVDAVQPSTDNFMPDTFMFDRERLSAIQSELHGILALEVCVASFRKIVSKLSVLHGQIPTETALLRLREALQDLMLSARHGRPWQMEIAVLALEIGRRAQDLIAPGTFPSPETIRVVEQILAQDLHLYSDGWQQQEEAARDAMWAEAFPRTKSFLQTPVLAMSDSATAGILTPPHGTAPSTVSSSPSSLLSSSPTLSSPYSDVARRVAHVTALHWRIFGSLIYVPADREEPCHLAAGVQDSGLVDRLQQFFL
ncbi:MAG: hypothetical protein M1825_003366 [Sarcosagium campestre]|nr:MAG: hypothetical protein M1825_003366 [Sarcosagium campestre]